MKKLVWVSFDSSLGEPGLYGEVLSEAKEYKDLQEAVSDLVNELGGRDGEDMPGDVRLIQVEEVSLTSLILNKEES